MDGQYNKEDADRDIGRAEALVASLGGIEHDLKRHVLAYENGIKPFKARLQRESEPLLAGREEALGELSEIIERLLASRHLKGKSLMLRSGTVSVRETSSLEVDEPLLMKLARKFGVWKQVSSFQSRKIKHTLINRLLETRPDLVDKLSAALTRKKTRRMTVKLPKPQVELSRELHPLRVTLSDES